MSSELYVTMASLFRVSIELLLLLHCCEVIVQGRRQSARVLVGTATLAAFDRLMQTEVGKKVQYLYILPYMRRNL